jgi:hypothetical protein
MMASYQKNKKASSSWKNGPLQAARFIQDLVPIEILDKGSGFRPRPFQNDAKVGVWN